jgi:hypothetical protein
VSIDAHDLAGLREVEDFILHMRRRARQVSGMKGG